MTVLKFLAPLFILIYSCNNNKSSYTTSTDSEDKVKTENDLDSNYLEKLDYIRMYPYSDSYDTSLTGGYSLSFCFDKENQYLLYKKDTLVIDTIAGCSLGMPYKYLGYVGADFDKTFVFVYSSGSANPYYIWLYDKETATNLIPDGGALIDVDTTSQILLYSKSDVPEKNQGDSMTLFDTRKMSTKDYAFPDEIFSEPQKLNRIHLVKVTDKNFTVMYEYNNWKTEKLKTYSR